jgi:tetratricopeptide (TPR) repeat protein
LKNAVEELKAKIISLTLVLLLIPLFTAVYIVQTRVDQISGKMSKEEYFSLLPKGELLKSVSLGYSAAIADFLWLEVVQNIGDSKNTEKRYEWIYHAVDVVTTLDPKFDYSYEIAGVALASLGKQYELSNKILLKGIQNMPEYWKLPFLLGFNYYFYLNDYQNGAVYMTKAASLPGHSAYLPGLAARLYVEAQDPDMAIEFLEHIYEETQDENVKKEIETRMREVMVERDILLLNRSLEIYEQRFKKGISALPDLVSSGIMSKVPEEPFGGYYFYDTNKKTAQSSTHSERMKVYRRPK